MLYLGLDAGATKTKAVLLSSDMKKVAESNSPGANATAIGMDIALKNIESVILALSNSINDNVKACLAIAGVDSEKSKGMWQEAIATSTKLKNIVNNPIILNDTRAAMRSATKSQDAVVVIAGTGSNCWGINSQGQEVKVGGGAHILGDQGSAYDIGLKILKIVHKNLDGRIPKTKLTKLFFNKFKINNREQLIDLVNKKPWQKADIAQVAPLVEEAAKENDKLAKEVLRESVNEIALMVETAVEKLNFRDKTYDLVTVGSVFNIEKLFKEEIQKRIKDFSPKVNFPKPMFDSATAAAHLAAELSVSPLDISL